MSKTIGILGDFVSMIGDRKLRDNVDEYLALRKRALETLPASIKYHCTYAGGLLDHIYIVTKISVDIMHYIKDFTLLNFDTIIVSALLHDIGKMFLYKNDKGKLGYVDEMYGRGIPHHSILVINDFEKKMNYVLPEEIKLAILGHHGGWSTTSVYPDSVESAILASADLIASRIGIKFKSSGDSKKIIE